MKCNLATDKVILGMSGGVDSTAAALLLAEKGFKVIGVYIDVTGNNENGRQEAEKAARDLGIKFLYKDVSGDFEDIVISNFCEEYLKGRTPNPCVLCNPAVKFKTLLDAADECGAYYVATGHYAKVYHNTEKDHYFIKKAGNQKKDQSYMLYRLTQEVLSRLLLPLAEIKDKDDVRGLVRNYSLANANLKDSQEICFIPNGIHYINYLMTRGYAIQKGDFINKDGEILGKHQGLVHYTIGQRKGLGITFGKPVFVTKLDDKTNQVMLGDHEELFGSEVISKENWFSLADGETMPPEYEGMNITAKIRYAAHPSEAVLYGSESGIVKTKFAKPQRAITPGQSIVFYQNDLLIGGGIID